MLYTMHIYNKRMSGKKEGFLHPIKKNAEPLNTFHIDHLGFQSPEKEICIYFPESMRLPNLYSYV